MTQLIVAVAAVLVFAPVSALAAGNELDAPPAGINPTTATLSQILKDHEAAVGRALSGVSNTRSEAWTFDKVGLRGTESLVRRGDDYHSRVTEGPLTEEYGQLGGKGWHKDFNGVVSPAQSEDYTSFEMLIFMDVLADAADPKNDAKLLGVVTTPAFAYVLEVKTPGSDHPEWIYYDGKTGLIDEAIRVVEGERATVTFDDYRATKGLKQPWHLHFHSGGLDFDFVRTALAIGDPVDARQFAMPVSTFAFAAFAGTASLPARLIDDRSYNFGWLTIVNPTPEIIVRVNVKGRGLDFGISAANPDSLIDRDVAGELGLPSFGQLTHAGGEDLAYDTVVGEANVGGLTLRNFAMRATTFRFQENYNTRVVGILGYDVLAAGVLSIDYVKGAVSLSPSAAFDHTDPVLGATSLPVDVESGFPFFKGVIDGHESSDILLDNEFDKSVIFGSFAQRFPDSVREENTGKVLAKAAVPFANSRAFGSEVLVWRASIPEIRWGPAHFYDLHITSSNVPIRMGGRQVDAVMGGDLLCYYDLYYDFPHGRVLMKPNSTFFKTFKER